MPPATIGSAPAEGSAWRSPIRLFPPSRTRRRRWRFSRSSSGSTWNPTRRRSGPPGCASPAPHKDDLVITIDGREAKSYSSQGQTRTAALALKLAEREIYQNATGEYPVLLLDDVLSELDPRRQEFVLNRIAGAGVHYLLRR